MGAWLVGASATLAAVTAFVLRTRAPAWLVAVLLAVAGAGAGAGGMLLQPDPSVGEFAAAVAVLAIMVPAHVRIVLGPFGPAGRGLPWRAAASVEELEARERKPR